MPGTERAAAFCKAVDEKKNAALTIIVIKDSGFRKFDLETEGGSVNVVRGYYQYDQNGCLQNRSTVSYPADIWQYTAEGYLIFEGSYFSDENSGVGAACQISEEIFEKVIMTYFNIDRETFRRETVYILEKATYEYRPRGLYEAEYPDIPYPKVVDYTENLNGTVTLITSAAYPYGNTSLAYSHRTVIHPFNEEVQFVSNQMISLENDRDIWWHSDRLTEEEWKGLYGGSEYAKESIEESEAESSLWIFPQAEKCLITEAEKDELKNCNDRSCHI